MSHNRLKKINKRAAQIVASQGVAYRVAQKRAGAEYRAGKIGGVKKRKRSIAKKPKTRVRHRVSGVSHRVSSVGSTPKGLEVMLRAKLKEQMAWMLLARDQEKTKTGRKKINIKLARLRRKLEAIS